MVTKLSMEHLSTKHQAPARSTRHLAWLARVLLYYSQKEAAAMLYYALVFLIVGLIAGALGIYGVAGVASQIAWVLFLIGIVFLIIHLISGSRRPII